MTSLPVISKDQEIRDLKRLNSRLREELAKSLETIVRIRRGEKK